MIKLNIVALAGLLGIVRVFAADVIWTGADETNPADWFTPSNWEGGVLPADGDSVIINSGSSIILSNSTPNLASIDVTGTLSFTNWMTRLNATTVTINEGGVLTCEGPFTEADMSNRVWVACQDFTLNAGGKVDVDLKGYGKPTSEPISAGISWGPGGAKNKKGAGAYGGYGGFNLIGDGTLYGSIDEPQDPGSTGNSQNGIKWATGKPAASAVRIDATGIVTLNGTITATGATSGSVNNQGAASGGSILIYSRKIVADGGSLIAKGGNQGNTSDSYMSAGGGGRIALHYDPEVQTTDDLKAITVSASGGTVYNSSRKAYKVGDADHGKSADVGTIWFKDEKFLKFLGTSLTGQIYLGTGNSYTCDSLTITKGWVRFAEEGFNLNVKGDVVLDGLDARLEMGGSIFLSHGYYHHLRSGDTPWSFTVGGNVSVINGARLDLYAAATNGVVESGGTLDVAGDFTIGENSKLYLSCDCENGGAPLIKAENVTIAETSIVSADYRGFTMGYGPGKGFSSSSYATLNEKTGAGHGGRGNGSRSGYGLIYDDPVRPTLPGSGGAHNYSPGSPLSGGGVIHIVAAKRMDVNGALSANSYATASSSGDSGQNRFATASGGSILLEGKKVSIGESATLSANGSSIKQAADNQYMGFKQGAVSGGGRIAIWSGSPYVEGETASWRIKATDKKPSEYLGSFTAAGGIWKWSDIYGAKLVKAGEKIGRVVSYTYSDKKITSIEEVDHGEEVAESDTYYICPLEDANIRAEDGTVMFVHVENEKGLRVIVR